MHSYLLMLAAGPRCRLIGTWPDAAGYRFMLGRWIRNIPNPFRYDLKPWQDDDHTPTMPAYFLGPVPLFSDAFIDALAVAGVDNFQRFDAVITDPDNGVTHLNYKAVNILGLIAAADMDKSIATIPAGRAIYDVDFDSLAIDPAAANGLGMFRLAEAISAVLVHGDVVSSLTMQGFSANTRFCEPELCAV